MKVMTIAGGELFENCYFAMDDTTGQVAVIDPGFWNQRLEDAIRQTGPQNIKMILLTHGHFDHIAGVAELQKETGATVYFPEKDRAFLTDPALNLINMMPTGTFASFIPDIYVKEGDVIHLGNTSFSVLETPGHTQGSCCYLTEEAIFTGDTLFFCSAGRTDFPTGSGTQLMASLKRLSGLPGDYSVYPGHEGATTLQYERSYNPYMAG
ncbi:MAG: MBL fold metallo-hydrolase [Hydrogeniiclostridium sp.]